MADQWDVINVEDHLVGQTECWVVDRKRPGDANFIRHVFPKATMEWRAAEYDLDITTPEGRADILDIVLHEPFMEDLYMKPPKPRVVNGRTVMGPPVIEAVHLYNAPTKADALRAHRDRMDKVKKGNAQVGAAQLARTLQKASKAPASPLQVIIDHEHDSAKVEEKRRVVHTMRGKLGLEPDWEPPKPEPRPFDPSIVEQSKTIKLEIAKSDKNASATGAPES